MRVWLLPILCGALACQAPSVSNESTTTSSESTGTSSESTGTSSESTDTSSESTDTSTETGDDEPDCADAAPGAEILRCLAGYAGELALDAGWLYFTEAGPEGQILERMRDDGSDHEVLAETIGDARTLTIVEGLIYWNNFFGGKVQRMPIDGGPIEDIVSELWKPNSYVIHEGMLYVTQYGDPYDLVRVSLDGGTPEVLYPALDYAGSLHLHDQDLWWGTNSNDGNVLNQIVRGTPEGDPPVVFLDDGGSVMSDETHLYWATGTPNEFVVHRMLYAGGPVEDVLTLDHGAALVLAGEYLYWVFVTIDRSGHDGEIHRMLVAGGPDELLVEGLNYPSPPVIGDTHMYWTTQQAIARLALP